MSTDFDLIKKGTTTLSIWESSNKINLSMESTADYLSLDDLTPQEVCDTALRMIQIASYYSKDSDAILEYAKIGLGRML